MWTIWGLRTGDPTLNCTEIPYPNLIYMAGEAHNGVGVGHAPGAGDVAA